MIAPGIAVISASKRATDSHVETMVDACRTQLEQHFAPAYSRMPASPRFYATLGAVPFGTPTLVVVDDSDQADALGYHTEGNDGSITGIVAVSPVLDAGGDLLTGDLSVASVLSHEILETALDPYVNDWIQAPNGLLWAKEACDPVQGDSYTIAGVTVSNFVLPAFWDDRPGAGSRFDYLAKLDGPFSLAPGGYAVVMKGGKVSQIGAAKPAWRVTSRSRRRHR